MNHAQHLASLGKGMSSAERASLVRNNSSSMSSQMAAINAALNQVYICLFTCHSERKGCEKFWFVRSSFNTIGALKMEAVYSSKMFAFMSKSMWCYYAEDQHHLHCHENLKYNFFLTPFFPDCLLVERVHGFL
jgi:hypothetical protein